MQGPRVRLGDLDESMKSVKLREGQEFYLYCKKKVEGNKDFICVENSDLAKNVKVGDHIIVGNGNAYLKVTGFKDEDEFLAE